MLEAGVASDRAVSCLEQKSRFSTQNAEPGRCEIPPRQLPLFYVFGGVKTRRNRGAKLVKSACQVWLIVDYISPGWAASGGLEM